MCHKNLCSLFMWGIVIKFMNIHGFSTETSSRENFPFSSIHTYDYRFFFSLNNFGVVLCHSLIDCSIIVLPFLWKATRQPQREKKKTLVFISYWCAICAFLALNVCMCICTSSVCINTHTRNQYHPHSLHTSKSPAHRLSHAFGLATSGINKNI